MTHHDPEGLTDAQWDSRLIASRRLVAETRRWPSDDNLARLATEIAVLGDFMVTAPFHKRSKISELMRRAAEIGAKYKLN